MKVFLDELLCKFLQQNNLKIVDLKIEQSANRPKERLKRKIFLIYNYWG